jgi:hypothetical protein
MGRRVTLGYRAWAGVDGVWWPAHIECEDGARDLRLSCRIHRVRFLRAVEPERLSLDLPPDTERLGGPAGLERALRRGGNP